MPRRALALVLLVLTLAVGPLAAADAYRRDDSLNAQLTGYLVTSAHDYRFPVEAGDVIVATLTWADAAQDLDLRVLPPGSTCVLTPAPDAECFLASVDRRLEAAVCADRSPLHAENGRETVTLTAATSGTWTAAVMAALAPGSTDYTLEVAVNGAAPPVTGPVALNYGGNSPACKLP